MRFPVDHLDAATIAGFFSRWELVRKNVHSANAFLFANTLLWSSFCFVSNLALP
jgi:hypothetical protein